MSVTVQPCSRATLTSWGHEAATWPASATGVDRQGVVVNVEKGFSGEPWSQEWPIWP